MQRQQAEEQEREEKEDIRRQEEAERREREAAMAQKQSEAGRRKELVGQCVCSSTCYVMLCDLFERASFGNMICDVFVGLLY